MSKAQHLQIMTCAHRSKPHFVWQLKMAFDEKAAQRIRDVIRNKAEVTEKQMFGGIAFLWNGNMFCGVNDDELMLRLGEEVATDSLSEPHVRQMDFTGRPLKSYVYVAAAGFKTKSQLKRWVDQTIRFAKTLPRKKK